MCIQLLSSLYIDPGTGSLLLQIVAGGAIASLMFFKKIWYSVFSFFKGKNETEKEIRKEYSYRSFKRSFTLDEKIDGNAIEAKYVNGVLTLNLPRKEEVKTASKDISIQ